MQSTWKTKKHINTSIMKTMVLLISHGAFDNDFHITVTHARYVSKRWRVYGTGICQLW